MVIDGSAIAAILARRAGSDDLLSRLEAARSPPFATPLALFEAAAGLARVKAETAGTAVTADLLDKARDAVAEFVVALGVRVVPITADIGRRAGDILGPDNSEAGRCFSRACAAAYRTALLEADPG